MQTVVELNQVDTKKTHLGDVLRTIMQRQEAAGVLVLVLLFGLLASQNPQFLTYRNLITVLRQLSYVAIAGLGTQLVISCGLTDLSVGSCMGLAGVLAAYVTVRMNGSDGMVLLSVLAVGLLFGFINGNLITRLDLNPFIITLATQMVGRGAVYVLTNAWPVDGFSKGLRFLGNGFFMGVPNPAWIMLICFAFFTWLLTSTKFGWHVYAIGGAEESARLSGIAVNETKRMAFLIAGVMGAIAGFLLTARLGTGEVTVAVGYEFDVIAATVLGGTRMGGGGRGGTALGLLVGAATMALLRNAIVMLSIRPDYQTILMGAAMLGAMMLDRMRRK